MKKLNNMSLSHIKGFNYHPSFAVNGLTRWLDCYDPDIVENELTRSKNYFPWMNAIRAWLSHDAYLINPTLFLSNLKKELAIYRKLGLKAMPVHATRQRGRTHRSRRLCQPLQHGQALK